MKDKIKELCKKIEKENNVKILFAIENGSRAWRMESEDSDYDVRFVFVRPLKEYLKIGTPRDVITCAFDKDGVPCKVEGSFIDLSGFDVFKFVRLLSKSNPTCIEWLISDIVYHGSQNKVFKKFALEKFNPMALYYHYKSSCKNNYMKYLSSRNLVTHKKYLYAFRGLINAKWVVNKNTVPPIVFLEAVEGLGDKIPVKIVSKLKEIIKLKSSGKEKDNVPNIVFMDDYIEAFLLEDLDFEKRKVDVSMLDDELQRILL
ncbi:DNA polymerase beta superfamily protein [Nanoarchaeota archaeon]